MPWWRQGGRSFSCLFRFHCLDRKLPRAAHYTSVTRYYWCVKLSVNVYRRSGFQYWAMCCTLTVSSSTTESIFLHALKTQTGWCHEEKYLNFQRAFQIPHFEELYTKKMRRTFLGDSHHWAPLANALCYRIIKLNKNIKRTNLDKTNKTHIYVYIFTLFIRGTILRSRPMDVWHIPHKCRKR